MRTRAARRAAGGRASSAGWASSALWPYARAGYNAAVLTGKQRRYLRSLGHELKVVVQIGKDGIDDGLVAAIDQALLDHELIKIKLGENAELDRQEAADAVAARTKSEVAQVLGYTILLYRPHPDDPTIVLPA